MPQLIPVTVSDGTDNHTFEPQMIDPQTGIATLIEDVNGVPVSANVLTVSSRRRGQKTVSKMMAYLPVSHTDPSSGNTTVSRTVKCTFEIEASVFSTDEERAKAVALAAALIGSDNALVDGALAKAQGVY